MHDLGRAPSTSAMNKKGETSTMTTSKLLFTPRPLTTSAAVKAAMLRDAGSRDRDSLQTVREICVRLLAIGGAASQNNEGEYECVLIRDWASKPSKGFSGSKL